MRSTLLSDSSLRTLAISDIDSSLSSTMLTLGEPVHQTKLPALLEIGRQSDGEPAPFSLVAAHLGKRLIIAPVTDRDLSRQHIRCEPCGREQVRITCTSRKNPIRLQPGAMLAPDQATVVALPCLLTAASYAVRIEL